MRAMILAAGRGERMRPLTDALPKPLLEVGGQPLIVWHLKRLSAAGIHDIVINHAWLGEKIESALGDGRRFGVSIRYSAEAQALETAGGIARALPLLGTEPFLVINGDIWCDWRPERAHAIAAQLEALNWQAWCVLVDNPEHHRTGDFVLEQGRLLDDTALPDDATGTRPRLTFSGIGIYHPALFDSIQQGTRAPLAPVLRKAATLGRAAAEHHQGQWTDVGTPERLRELDARLSTVHAGMPPPAFTPTA
jgi:MurNAc alpha-1-phosphate uridylyltransferase